MNDRTLIGALIVAVILFVGLMGQYSLKLERENQRLHEQVDASTIPPSTNYVRTR